MTFIFRIKEQPLEMEGSDDVMTRSPLAYSAPSVLAPVHNIDNTNMRNISSSFKGNREIYIAKLHIGDTCIFHLEINSVIGSNCVQL